MGSDKAWPPILRGKNHGAASVFTPDALLREARRQKRIKAGPVPEICFLDPDGDIVRRLKQTGAASRSETWPCYHSDLYEFALAERTAGIVAARSAHRSRCCRRKSCSPAGAAFSSASRQPGRSCRQALCPISS